MAEVRTLVIDKFLGIRNDASGDTNLKIGELSQMQNFQIVEGYNCVKRSGYTAKLNAATTKPIRGQWYGDIGGTHYHLIACNGHIYKVNSDNSLTDLGTLTDATTNFFYFGSAVYIQNGTQYKKWTGTGSISDVVGYIPTVMVSTTPGGSGTTYEGINLLSQYRIQKFNGDNTSATYILTETDIDSVTEVKVGGVAKTETTHYTVSLAAGTVTFTSGNIPPVGVNNVEIKWKNKTSVYNEVARHTNSNLYGGKNDNRVFLYGYDDKTIYSGLAAGVPSAEYFPALNFIQVGRSNEKVTHLITHYDRQVIYKEDSIFYCTYSYDATVGVSFPTYPLNTSIGNSFLGKGQLIENNPVVIYGRNVYELVASQVRDERNVKYISQRVQPLLNTLTITTLETFDNSVDHEYWIVSGKSCYIYNYNLDLWYYYYFADNVVSIIRTDAGIMLGTDVGQLMLMDSSRTDNGTLINAFIETGYFDYNMSNRNKFLNFMWVQIKPDANSTADVYVETDRRGIKLVKSIGYRHLAFDDTDFADFSFLIGYSPKGFRIKAKAKKFVYVKFTIINETDNSLTLLGITAPAIIGGTSK